MCVGACMQFHTKILSSLQLCRAKHCWGEEIYMNMYDAYSIHTCANRKQNLIYSYVRRLLWLWGNIYSRFDGWWPIEGFSAILFTIVLPSRFVRSCALFSLPYILLSCIHPFSSICISHAPSTSLCASKQTHINVYKWWYNTSTYHIIQYSIYMYHTDTPPAHMRHMHPLFISLQFRLFKYSECLSSERTVPCLSTVCSSHIFTKQLPQRQIRSTQWSIWNYSLIFKMRRCWNECEVKSERNTLIV